MLCHQSMFTDPNWLSDNKKNAKTLYLTCSLCWQRLQGFISITFLSLNYTTPSEVTLGQSPPSPNPNAGRTLGPENAVLSTLPILSWHMCLLQIIMLSLYLDKLISELPNVQTWNIIFWNVAVLLNQSNVISNTKPGENWKQGGVSETVLRHYIMGFFCCCFYLP